jgi:Fe-S cluster biosynthesis and repair protein YggX
MTPPQIHCRRCDDDVPPRRSDPLPALRRTSPRSAPFRNELGTRIAEEICASCWQEWLQHQTLLINHYGLDPRDPKSRAFLYEQIEQVLLQGGEGKDIDTTKQGEIQW